MAFWSSNDFDNPQSTVSPANKGIQTTASQGRQWGQNNTQAESGGIRGAQQTQDPSTVTMNPINHILGGTMNVVGKYGPMAAMFVPGVGLVGAAGLGIAGHFVSEAGKGISGHVDGPTSKIANGMSQGVGKVTHGVLGVAGDAGKAAIKHPMLSTGALLLAKAGAKASPVAAVGVGTALVAGKMITQHGVQDNPNTAAAPNMNNNNQPGLVNKEKSQEVQEQTEAEF